MRHCNKEQDILKVKEKVWYFYHFSSKCRFKIQRSLLSSDSGTRIRGFSLQSGYKWKNTSIRTMLIYSSLSLEVNIITV